MRILFINTLDNVGGAAIVLGRLMSGLREIYDSTNLLLTKQKFGNSESAIPVLSSRVEIITEKIIDRVTRKAGLLYQYFPFSSAKILEQAKNFQPDIINLHNTHSGFFATPLIPKLSEIAPIVWTLHDMWSFTGNSAHTFGNKSWMQLRNDNELTAIPPAIGINTGSWLLRQKKRLYSNSDLTVVTPSAWLKHLAEQSPVFNGKQIHHIFNGIDSRIFSPKDKLQCKIDLGLPTKEKIAMFSAQDLDRKNPWKGGADLFSILSKIDDLTRTKINLLMVGNPGQRGFDAFKNLNIISKGYIHSEEEMSNYLNAADLFIYPTRADNLPNVLVESIACNTPCITFDVGGNKEIIFHNVNGIIISPGELDQFATETISLLLDEKRLEQFAIACVPIVKERFSLQKMVNEYYSLFQKSKR